jgi:hypothetical protein
VTREDTSGGADEGTVVEIMDVMGFVCFCKGRAMSWFCGR